MDNKHWCKIRYPGSLVAAIERGKKIVVPTNGKQFTVADYNFNNSLLCDIP